LALEFALKNASANVNVQIRKEAKLRRMAT
jgi:hypothetical protein